MVINYLGIVRKAHSCHLHSSVMLLNEGEGSPYWSPEALQTDLPAIDPHLHGSAAAPICITGYIFFTLKL